MLCTSSLLSMCNQHSGEEVRYRAARLATHIYSAWVCQHLPQLGIALGKAGPESFIPTENGPFG